MLGARQVGKTTLSKELAKEWEGPARHFDLEDPDDQARLGDPSFVLRELKGLVVIDEVQFRPDLFTLLRVLADRPECPARFLLLGSAAPQSCSKPRRRQWQAGWCSTNWTGWNGMKFFLHLKGPAPSGWTSVG